MYIHTYVHTYRCTYIQMYIHTDVHTYRCTYIQMYIHTYVHTYICTYNLLWKSAPDKYINLAASFLIYVGSLNQAWLTTYNSFASNRLPATPTNVQCCTLHEFIDTYARSFTRHRDLYLHTSIGKGRRYLKIQRPFRNVMS
jgi:hypothetical protein